MHRIGVRLSSPLAAFAIGAFGILAACSSDTDGTTASADQDGGPGKGGDGSPSGGDGGNGGGDGSDGGGDDAGALLGAGGVYLSNQDAKVNGVDIKQWVASAAFARATAPASTGCTQSTFGACTVTKCTSAAAAPAPAMLSGGAIQIAGANVPVTLMPDQSANRYTAKYASASLWNGGETVSVQTGGDASGAPSFELSVTAPRPPEITSPNVQSGTPFAISRQAPISIAWTNTSATPGAIVRASIGVAQGPGMSQSILCEAPSSALTLAVPVAALAELGTGTGSFAIYAVSTESIEKAGYALSFALTAWATSQGALASTSAQIQ